MSLPERINVMKVVSYDVQQICENIHECHKQPFDEITIEDCLEWIRSWVEEDFNGDIEELIYQDENGEEL